MTQTTYQFYGFDVQGQQHSFEVNAKNMRAAVAQFMARTDRPAVFGWRVMSSKAFQRSYPVTRERWGHAFDGRDA